MKKMTVCQFCNAISEKNMLVCCSQYANEEMLRILKLKKKEPSREFLLRLKKLILNNQGTLPQENKEEAFSFSEVIDKFLIIALKNSYLDGERLIQNKIDYKAIEEIVGEKFSTHTVTDIKKALSLFESLWDVNAEIFCINDICGGEKDDRIVAAAARRMMDMIKERNKLKHKIADVLGEKMYETKQFQKNISVVSE